MGEIQNVQNMEAGSERIVGGENTAQFGRNKRKCHYGAKDQNSPYLVMKFTENYQ